MILELIQDENNYRVLTPKEVNIDLDVDELYIIHEDNKEETIELNTLHEIEIKE